MKLRTRLDLISAALLSALGATQLACGGRAAASIDDSGGSSGTGATSTSGNGPGGSEQGGTAGNAHSGGGGGVRPPPSNNYPCKNPKDLGNGLVACDGFVHRQAAVKCASHVPRPEPIPNPDMFGPCKFDADCTDKPYGYCSSGADIGGSYCFYGCVTDSECGDHQLCQCAEPVGHCVQADCVSDADCETGFLCKSHDASGGCGILAFTCQSAADTCGGNADCASSADSSNCHFIREKQAFQCSSVTCVVGRPFLVDGRDRLARSAPRADWSERALLPLCSGLNEALRRDLAERWTRIARMEHASIAAFARFTLQLLSVGAEASLLELAHAALRDETKHAKACFAVASTFAGTPLGPARLAVERSLSESSFEEIVLNTIREGCVGETVAAVEAREAAEHAKDPALRSLLLEISEDETRHAELAYRFVQWALSQGGPALMHRVRREFAALAEQVPHDASPPTVIDDDLLRYGIVPEALRRVIRGETIARVILPCAQALFAAEQAPCTGDISQHSANS